MDINVISKISQTEQTHRNKGHKELMQTQAFKKV
jgi:hypothetical protein